MSQSAENDPPEHDMLIHIKGGGLGVPVDGCPACEPYRAIMFCDYMMPLAPVGFEDGVIKRPTDGGGNLLVCCRAPHDDEEHLVETPEHRLQLQGPLP